VEKRCRDLQEDGGEENRCPGRRCQRDASCDLGEEGAWERVPGPRSRNNNSIKAEAAPIPVNRKHQLQNEQEEIGPRPLPRSIVEAEPEVEDLQRADDTPKRTKIPRISDTAVSTSSE